VRGWWWWDGVMQSVGGQLDGDGDDDGDDDGFEDEDGNEGGNRFVEELGDRYDGRWSWRE